MTEATIYEYETDPNGRPRKAYELTMVQPGENLRLVAERVGIDYRRLMTLNEATLRDEAQARGFTSHTFMRPVPDDDGGAIHDNGSRVRNEPDAHVFAGQLLRVRPADEEQKEEQKAEPPVTPRRVRQEPAS